MSTNVSCLKFQKSLTMQKAVLDTGVRKRHQPRAMAVVVDDSLVGFRE